MSSPALLLFLLVAAAPTSSPPWFVESADSLPKSPGADNRTYRVEWPDGDPKGIVVFLHGLSYDPIDEEGDTMDAIAREATARGYIALFPFGYRACGTEYCWRLSDIDGEIDDVMDLIFVVEQQAGKHLRRRQLIGFSNGGFLVGGALQRNLLSQFTRVGVVAGGPVGVTRPAHSLPQVYMEVGRSDPYQRPTTKKLYASLAKARPRDDIRFREVAGDHDFNPDRAVSFLHWFWNDEAAAAAAPSPR